MQVLFSPKEDWESPIRESLEGSRYVPVFRELTDETLQEADVVFPLRVPDLLRAVDSAEASGKAVLPTRESILTANDKLAFNAFLIEDGFDVVVPEIYQSERSYPYILKPSIGEWGSDIHIVNGPEDEAPLSAELDSPTFYAQRYIEGHEDPGAQPEDWRVGRVPHEGDARRVRRLHRRRGEGSARLVDWLRPGLLRRHRAVNAAPSDSSTESVTLPTRCQRLRGHASPDPPVSRRASSSALEPAVGAGVG